LIEEFCTFFTAGTDTTSHFTEMMVYYISQNSQIEEKLRKQIDEVIKSDEDITKENLKKLTYIDWIQN
jgi:cytochrome P450